MQWLHWSYIRNVYWDTGIEAFESRARKPPILSEPVQSLGKGIGGGARSACGGVSTRNYYFRVIQMSVQISEILSLVTLSISF